MKEGTVSINCPGEFCPKQLEYNEIQEFADSKAFSKYFPSPISKPQQLSLDMTNFFVEKSTKKTPTSDGAQIAPVQWDKSSMAEVPIPFSAHLNIESSSYFTCFTCNFKSCFRCRTPVHPNINCTENLNHFRAQQFAADPESGSWLRSYTKPCFCGRWIQKMDGCDHVKCLPRPMGCGDEWCWMCGAKYDDIRRVGNTAHKGDCPHYM